MCQVEEQSRVPRTEPRENGNAHSVESGSLETDGGQQEKGPGGLRGGMRIPSWVEWEVTGTSGQGGTGFG